MDLQLQRIAIRTAEGDQTGDERLEAGCKTVAGMLSSMMAVLAMQMLMVNSSMAFSRNR